MAASSSRRARSTRTRRGTAAASPALPADALVVGAGHNGLVCAAYLARAGLDVVVLEARADVGGTAATVAALGARVNACNCDHILVRSLPLVAELELARHGLHYLDVDPTQLSVPWSGQPAWLQFRDVARTLESLRAVYPGQVDPYRRYLRAAMPVADLVLELALAPPTPARVARVAARRPRAAATLLAWSRRSAVGVLRSFFSDDALVAPACVTGPGVWGVAPTRPRTGLGVLGYALRHRLGVGRPVGGSGALPLALRRALEAWGGRVRTDAPVREILVEESRVLGIALADGERIDARRVVLACDPRRAPLRWLARPPARVESWATRAAARRTGEGYQSKLDAIVAAPPRYRAPLGALEPTAVLAPSVAELAEADAAMRRGEIAPRPPMLVNVPSAVDETMRLGEDHVFSLEPLYTPRSLRGGWHGSSEPDRWLREYAALVEPGFLEGVRDRRVVTPPDWERDFGMPRGAVQTFSGGPLATLLPRDRDLSRYETPVEGLYLTGSATFPGAGIWGASGRNAATTIIRAIA